LHLLWLFQPFPSMPAAFAFEYATPNA